METRAKERGGIWTDGVGIAVTEEGSAGRDGGEGIVSLSYPSSSLILPFFISYFIFLLFFFFFKL